MKKTGTELFCALAALFLLSLLPGHATAQPLRIVYSNDNRGELLSCGCSYDIGGMARKATFLQRLRQQDSTPLLVLDAGNLLFKQAALPEEPGKAEAARIRARGAVAANLEMGNRFAGIAAHDLAAGPGFLKRITDKGFVWLSANLVEARTGERLFTASVTVQAGDLKVAILGLTDPLSRTGEDWTLLPWQEVLPTLVSSLRSQADLIILLSNQSFLENRKIAAACPGLDLIFQAGYTLGNMPPVITGQTLITQTVTRGKYLGLLDIDWKGHGPWLHLAKGAVAPDDRTLSTFNQRFVPMDATQTDDPAMSDFVDRFEQEARAAARR